MRERDLREGEGLVRGLRERGPLSAGKGLVGRGRLPARVMPWVDRLLSLVPIAVPPPSPI